jgi:hypothetical protein
VKTEQTKENSLRERHLNLIKKFLEKLTFPGICGFWVDGDDQDDLISVYIIIDNDFIFGTRTQAHPTHIVRGMKLRVKNKIKDFLDIDVYVGNIVKDCNKLENN